MTIEVMETDERTLDDLLLENEAYNIDPSLIDEDDIDPTEINDTPFHESLIQDSLSDDDERILRNTFIESKKVKNSKQAFLFLLAEVTRRACPLNLSSNPKLMDNIVHELTTLDMDKDTLNIDLSGSNKNVKPILEASFEIADSLLVNDDRDELLVRLEEYIAEEYRIDNKLQILAENIKAKVQDSYNSMKEFHRRMNEKISLLSESAELDVDAKIELKELENRIAERDLSLLESFYTYVRNRAEPSISKEECMAETIAQYTMFECLNFLGLIEFNEETVSELKDKLLMK